MVQSGARSHDAPRCGTDGSFVHDMEMRIKESDARGQKKDA